MILCFGIFAKVLNCCNQGLPQDKFVPRIAWVVDERNSSLGHELDDDVDNPDSMEGNKEVVSKLLSCKQKFVIRGKNLPSIEDARNRFREKVLPYINEDKITIALLAILYIIDEDKTISNAEAIDEDEKLLYGSNKCAFKRYIGMDKDELLRQTKFNVPDFFARVLLYTTCVDNRKGAPYAKKITFTFVKKTASDGWAKFKWDPATQTVELISESEQKLKTLRTNWTFPQPRPLKKFDRETRYRLARDAVEKALAPLKAALAQTIKKSFTEDD